MSIQSKLKKWEKEVKQIANEAGQSAFAQSRRTATSQTLLTICNRAERMATMPLKETRLNVPPLL